MTDHDLISRLDTIIFQNREIIERLSEIRDYMQEPEEETQEEEDQEEYEQDLEPEKRTKVNMKKKEE